MSATGIYGGLGAQSMQTLAGFFMQCQGRYAPFLYVDPTDFRVTAQLIGIGDGVTKTFTWVRTIGGFTEPVGAVTSVGQVLINGVPSVYSATSTKLTFTTAPANGAVITADFSYAFVCRFNEDVEDFEEFMALLSACKTVTFTGVRDIVPVALQTVTTIIIDDPAITVWTAPSNLLAVLSVEAFAGGSGGGSGDYGRWAGNGGGYAIAFNPPINPGQSCQLVIGPGGVGGGTPGQGDLGGGGGDTIFYLGTGNPYLLTTIVHAYGNGSSGYPTGQPGGQPGAQIPYLTHGTGPAGGGAGGPHGPGINGGDGIQNSVVGPGGGAADGGGTPSGPVGGAAWDGSPGGQQGSGWGANGVHGSGGAGGVTGSAAGAGGLGIGYTGTGYLTSSSAGGAGGGGGGGGGGADPARVGGDGGKWGGGGGAGGNTSPFTNFPGGHGGVGGIIITLQTH